MDKKVILIADDESSIRTFVSRALGKTHTVLAASNGEEAIQMARAHQPDIIFMDIMMPKVDGYTACATIKADPALKTIPVIMVTGLGYQLNKDLAKRLGSESYITKPFTADDLKRALAQYLGQE